MTVVPFNAAWFLFLGVMAAFGVCLHYGLRGRSVRTQKTVAICLAAASVALYTTFTFDSILDPAVTAVNLTQNLPFHLCNLVAWGLIPAYFFDWAWLRTFCFFPGTLTGILTLTSPVPVYIGHPLVSLEAIGFYGVHSMNAILGFLLVSLGFYQPSFRRAFEALGFLVALAACVIFPLDLFFRAFIDPGANYFYLFDPESADILAAAHNLLPVPLIYMLLLTPVALAGFLLEAAAYRTIHHLRHRGPTPNPAQETVRYPA
jgi:uncharacterized membrane protein YwaF